MKARLHHKFSSRELKVCLKKAFHTQWSRAQTQTGTDLSACSGMGLTLLSEECEVTGDSLSQPELGAAPKGSVPLLWSPPHPLHFYPYALLYLFCEGSGCLTNLSVSQFSSLSWQKNNPAKPKTWNNPNTAFCWVSKLEEFRKGIQQEPELANRKGRTPCRVREQGGTKLPPFSSRAVSCLV